MRYARPSACAAERGADVIATGTPHRPRRDGPLPARHLSRDAGLLGLPPRSGDVIRPLLALGREQTRELAAEAGLPFRDDPPTATPLCPRPDPARGPAGPARAEPGGRGSDRRDPRRAAEEATRSRRLPLEALGGRGVEAGAMAIQAAALADLHPAVRRLACGHTRSAPRAGRCRSAARARRRSGGWPARPRAAR